MNLLGLLESNFQCSGICYSHKYYIFSDINNSPVEHTGGCKEYIQDFFTKFGKIVYIVSFIAMAIMLINAIATFCLCCRRKHHHESGGIYQRMNYYDDWEQGKKDLKNYWKRLTNLCKSIVGIKSSF